MPPSRRPALESVDDPRVFLELAGLALAEGRFIEARLDAEAAQARLKAAKLGPEAARIASVEAASALASVAETVGDWPTAAARLLDLLAIDPTKAAARVRLARAMIARGGHEGGFKEVTRTAKDDPGIGPPC